MARVLIQGVVCLLAGLIASGAFAQRISDLPDFGDVAGDDAGDLNLSEFVLYCPGCAVHRLYSRNRSITADEVGDFFIQLTQDSLTCGEVDGSPAVSPLDSILFDSADGFTVTDAGSEDARIDWAPVANQITLGTHTTGNYVATVADAGSGTVTVTGSGGEAAAVTLDVNTSAIDIWVDEAGDTMTGNLLMNTATGPALVNEAASSTNPTLIPNRADPETGVGWHNTDTLALVTGGDMAVWIDTVVLRLRGGRALTFFDDDDTNFLRFDGPTDRTVDRTCTFLDTGRPFPNECIEILDDDDVSDTLTASTSTTAAANDDDTSIATTAFVQQEINGAGGRSLTAAAGTIDADQELYEHTKCINVDPAHTTTDWLFFRAERAITVIGIDCLVDAATSVVMTLRECNADGASCGDTEAAITCGTTNTTEASSIDDASVDAGDWMRVTRGTLTGSATQANLCVSYTVAD